MRFSKFEILKKLEHMVTNKIEDHPTLVWTGVG
jgi:hypothetical protein